VKFRADTPKSLLQVTPRDANFRLVDIDDLITTQQAADLLGVGVKWVNKLAARGTLPVAHQLPGPTGAKLYRRADIEAEQQRRQTAA
jgi:hypothetical protein